MTRQKKATMGEETFRINLDDVALQYVDRGGHEQNILPNPSPLCLGDLASVLVTWTVDMVPRESPDRYTISVQLIDLATSVPLSQRLDTEFQF